MNSNLGNITNIYINQGSLPLQVDKKNNNNSKVSLR